MKIEKVVDIQCRNFDNAIAGDPGACRGNTLMVRVGDRVFATFMQQEPGRAPYNQCCLELYEKRGEEPWKLAFRDEGVYQLDPAPIMYLGDNRLAVTANPPVAKYAKEEESKMVNAIPVVYLFDIEGEVKKTGTFMIPWNVPNVVNLRVVRK